MTTSRPATSRAAPSAPVSETLTQGCVVTSGSGAPSPPASPPRMAQQGLPGEQVAARPQSGHERRVNHGVQQTAPEKKVVPVEQVLPASATPPEFGDDTKGPRKNEIVQRLLQHVETIETQLSNGSGKSAPPGIQETSDSLVRQLRALDVDAEVRFEQQSKKPLSSQQMELSKQQSERDRLRNEMGLLRSEAIEWSKAQRQREIDLRAGLEEAEAEKDSMEKRLATMQCAIDEMRPRSNATGLEQRLEESERQRHAIRRSYEEAQQRLQRSERERASLQRILEAAQLSTSSPISLSVTEKAQQRAVVSASLALCHILGNHVRASLRKGWSALHPDRLTFRWGDKAAPRQ